MTARERQLRVWWFSYGSPDRSGREHSGNTAETKPCPRLHEFGQLPFERAVFQAIAGQVRLACLLGLVFACSETTQPIVTSVEPHLLFRGEETTVTVRGSNFFQSSSLNLDDRATPAVNSAWKVRIGVLAIPRDHVHQVDAQTLTVAVPGTLALGTHELVLTTPAGSRATWSSGLTVIDGGGETSTTNGPLSSEAAVETSGTGETLETTSSGLDTESVASGEQTTGAQDAGGTEQGVLRAALTHRYSFERAGTEVVDSVGGAHGTFIGATLDGLSGNATFSGGGEYIDLPSTLIANYGAVTIEVWLVWDAPNQGPAQSWQRIFDFGSNDAPGLQGGQDTHLFLTPRAGGPEGSLLLSYRGNLTGSVTLETGSRLATGALTHVAAVVDGVNGQMVLYVDGTQSASRVLDFPLSSIDFRNVWLGRSQVEGDPAFQGRIFEFRVYERALEASSLRASHAAGPDAAL